MPNEIQYNEFGHGNCPDCSTENELVAMHKTGVGGIFKCETCGKEFPY